MNMSEKVRNMVRASAPYWEAIPDGTYFEVTSTGLDFQAWTQDKVRKIRAAFPGSVWQKKYNENSQWWEYDCTYNGMQLHIYACKEAPPTCRAIIETYTAVEKVPVAFEDRAVTKERIHWECGPGEEP